MAPYKGVFMVSVSGQKDLSEVFEGLPKSLTDSVLRETAKKALKPVAEMAQSLAPVGDTGNLRDSIIVSTQLTKRQRRAFPHRKGEVHVYAGPSYKLGAGGRHGHLVEFGTGPRYNKSGKYLGIMPARPFMRPAWDALSSSVLKTMQEEIWGVLLKAVRRMRKRAERGTLSKSQTKFFTG